MPFEHPYSTVDAALRRLETGRGLVTCRVAPFSPLPDLPERLCIETKQPLGREPEDRELDLSTTARQPPQDAA